MKFKHLIVTFGTFFFAAAHAQAPSVCMILDKGGKDDKSFNQAAYEGFMRAKNTFPQLQDSKYVTVRDDSQAPQFVRTFSAEKCGLIIAVGFNNADTVHQIAPQFPTQPYVVIDSAITGNNIRAVSFEEHEGGFLMGAIAALKTQSQKIGFIGGMQIPLIKRFQTGFEAGVKYINSKLSVSQSYVGITSSAWNNPAKAKELALAMYEQGVDIIFVAAGASSQGVFDAVEQANKVSKNKKFVIGVDSNQNYIVPGFVLTSMEKKVDVEVFNTIKAFNDKKLQMGVVKIGFKENGLNWSLDKYNASLFSPVEVKKINKIKNNIIENKIAVPDYYKLDKTSVRLP